MPQEPPPTRWVLPSIDRLPPELASEDLVGFGGDLEPGTLLSAYRSGLFPMHVPFDDEDGEAVDRMVVARAPRRPAHRRHGHLALTAAVVSSLAHHR